jgi:hypothetical protein
MKAITLLACCALLLIGACDMKPSEKGTATYVKPSVDRRGRFRKGHIRFKTSAKKDAIKSQNRSRYYYHTRGKYRSKK